MYTFTEIMTENCTASNAGHVRYVGVSGKYTEVMFSIISIFEGILSRLRISSTRPSSEDCFGYEPVSEVG